MMNQKQSMLRFVGIKTNSYQLGNDLIEFLGLGGLDPTLQYYLDPRNIKANQFLEKEF